MTIARTKFFGPSLRAPRQINCISRLRIGAREHHRSIDGSVLPLLPRRFGSTVRNYDLAGVRALIDRALIAGPGVHMFKYRVFDAVEGNRVVLAGMRIPMRDVV